MKKLIYIIAFFFPIAIMFSGFYYGDHNIVYSGFSLLFFIFISFIGSTIKEIKKDEIDLSKLKIAIPLFILSIGVLIYCASINKIYIGAILSFILGIYSCVLLYKKN